MKKLLATYSSALATLHLVGAQARAHPGHFVLDYSGGVPHAGHESELGILLISAALSAALFAAARWLRKRS